MFCSQCGAQVPDGSAFCQECGAAMAQGAELETPEVERPAPREAQFRLHPALVGFAVAAVLGVVVLVLFLAGRLGGGGGDGGLGGGSDEDQVRALLERYASLWNDRDWRGLYETAPPAVRESCPFEEFRDKVAFGFAFTGGKEIDIRDIDVTVEGDTAYASYDIYVGGEFFNREDSYRFVKEDGRWYDKDDDDSC